MIKEFLATVGERDGKDYKRDSLCVVFSALKQFLTKKCKNSIFYDRELKSSKKCKFLGKNLN